MSNFTTIIPNLGFENINVYGHSMVIGLIVVSVDVVVTGTANNVG